LAGPEAAPRDDLDVIEPANIHDMFVEGVMAPEIHASYIRVKLTAKRFPGDPNQEIVVVSLVSTFPNAARMLAKILASLGRLLLGSARMDS
jgi:hypothetical protein